MRLLLEQAAFVKDTTKLLIWLESKGYLVTEGEGERSPEQQAIHVKNGRSKTMRSNHLIKCAHDWNIFKSVNGKWVQCTYEDLQEAGDYWESLSIANRWGGRFKTLVDTPHFERNIQV